MLHAPQLPVGIMKLITARRNMKYALSEVRLYMAFSLAALRQSLVLRVNRYLWKATMQYDLYCQNPRAVHV